MPENENQFAIYQIKRGDEYRDYRYESIDRLEARGLAPDPAHYEHIYTGALPDVPPAWVLEHLYEKFNLDIPPDFTGHSLAVSDVVLLRQDGKETAHFVDSVGFYTLTDFAKDLPAYSSPTYAARPEKNFRIEETDNSTFVVRSDSERFGKDAIVYEGTRKECVSYIAERVPASEWRFYVIPDLKTWATNEPPVTRSDIYYYNTLDEAMTFFNLLRGEPYNSEKGGLNPEGEPYARLTLGIDRLDATSAIDILHVRHGQNYLVTDFARGDKLNTDPAVLDILARVSAEIGFDRVKDYARDAAGHYRPTRNIPFSKWKNPYFDTPERPKPPEQGRPSLAGRLKDAKQEAAKQEPAAPGKKPPQHGIE